MNQPQQLQGLVTGDGKVYTIFFDASREDAVREKYAGKGATLKIGTAPALQAAPVSLVRRSAWKDENNRHGHVKTRSDETRGNPARGGRRSGQLKAVVNLTTGQYFPCITDAATAINSSPNNLSPVLNGKMAHIKGNRYRWATESEKAAGKVLVVKTPQSV